MTEATIERTRETLRPRTLAATAAAIAEITETPLPDGVKDDSNDVSVYVAAQLMTVVFLVEDAADRLIAAEQTNTNAGFAVGVLTDAIDTIKMTAALSRMARS